MANKFCGRCSESKPVTDFYANRQRKDGLSSYCKPCTIRQIKETKNTENDKAIKKRWAKEHPDKVREWNRRYMLNNASKRREYARRFEREHVDHKSANNAVFRAVKSGRLIRPDACPACGATGKRIEAHHNDYAKPLAVEWLCTPCHRAADKARAAQERTDR